MIKKYTSEKNIQILIALLKKHKIRKVIASPGTTNLNFVASLQNDSWFEVYSSVDERSAAYIACGMADQLGEPVIITCTEATASRNYMSGLTEAYYRKLPILAITGTRGNYISGNLVPQSIDRSLKPNDICKLSVELPCIKDEHDVWNCEILANKALLELKRNGGGPVHINLCTTYVSDFSCCELPDVKAIDRITTESEYPVLPQNKKIAICIGSHKKFSQAEIKLIELFCEKYGAVVFADHTSRYHGKNKILFSLIGAQRELDKKEYCPEICIYFGNVSGGNYPLPSEKLWLVNEDGEIRDRFHNIEYVFQMTEKDFLKGYVYNEISYQKHTEYYNKLIQTYNSLSGQLMSLPFSNCWIAQYSSKLFPIGSFVYFGILNTLRTWNYFELSNDVDSISNVGGFGIDGGLSTVLGSSLANKGKICYGIVGDLGFFYDLNALGNRHISNDIRIMLINNGRGIEFRIDDNIGSAFEDEDADKFFAAAGHFANQSRSLVKNYSIDMGFEYFSASSKEEYIEMSKRFFSEEHFSKPIVFEVFIDQHDECMAHTLCRNIYKNNSLSRTIKDAIKTAIGDHTITKLKSIIK